MKEILVFDKSAGSGIKSSSATSSKVIVQKAFAARLRRLMTRAAREFFADKRVAVAFILVGDSETKRLNLEYLSRAGTTDVISFYYAEPPVAKNIDGDVFINVAQAARQCPLSGRASKISAGARRPSITDVEKEILLLAVHGLLHLAGYKDYTADQKARMWRMQNKILRRLA